MLWAALLFSEAGGEVGTCCLRAVSPAVNKDTSHMRSGKEGPLFYDMLPGVFLNYRRKQLTQIGGRALHYNFFLICSCFCKAVSAFCMVICG